MVQTSREVTRRSSLAMLAGAAGVVLAACGEPTVRVVGSPEEARGPAGPAGPEGPKGATGQQGAQGAAGAVGMTQVLVEYWNKSRPSHPEQIGITAVMKAWEEQGDGRYKLLIGQNAQAVSLDKFKTSIAAGAPPNISVSYNFNGSDLNTTGGLVNFDEQLKAEKEWGEIRQTIYPQLLRSNTWKDFLYGIPAYNSYFNMYYSPALLQAAGLEAPKEGWTFDEFLGMAQQAAKPPDIWGYNSAWVTAHWMMWFGSNGGKFTNDEVTKVTLTSPEGLEALEWELGLVQKNLQKPHDGSGGGGYKELLPQQQVVFQFAVPARLTLYKNDNISFATTKFPIGPKNTAGTPYTTGAAYAFNVYKHEDEDAQHAAALAAMWGAGRDGQFIFARETNVPLASRAVTESQEYINEFSGDTEYWPFIEVNPFFDPYPNYPKYWPCYGILTTQLRRVWAGEAGPREALEQAQRESQVLLDESLAL